MIQIFENNERVDENQLFFFIFNQYFKRITMFRLLFVFTLLLCFNGIGQTTTVSTNTIDFGEITALTTRYQDISIRNKGEEPCYILRVDHSPELVYNISTDIIYPDSTFFMRIQVNPKSKGHFNYVVRIYLSDQLTPTEIRVKGNVVELPDYSQTIYTKCPDFKSTPTLLAKTNLTVITVDKLTGTPLARTSVAIIRNGSPAGAWITGKNGSFTTNTPAGYFYFLAAHEGYLKKEAGVYIHPEINEITIPLSKDSSFVVSTSEQSPIAETSVSLTKEEAQRIISTQLATPTNDSIVQQSIPELAQIPISDFSSTYFKPVNVIFVLDISSSMKMGEKMDLLKYSMNQLIDMLRPEDQLGIVVYSNKASVYQVSTPGDRKEILRNSIDKLKPMGLSAGGKGIQLGYKQVMQQYNSTQTNLVIVITDGAFNKESNNYQKTVRRYAKKGIILSVVGVQASKKDAELMTTAAAFGNGRYVSVQKLADAHNNLKQEIRVAAFKR